MLFGLTLDKLHYLSTEIHSILHCFKLIVLWTVLQSKVRIFVWNGIL